MVELMILAGFLFLLVIGDIAFTSFMYLIYRFLDNGKMGYIKYMKAML